MDLKDCEDLLEEIRHWPGVYSRQEETQTVLFTDGTTNFCWFSPASGMFQVRPYLGPKICDQKKRAKESEEPSNGIRIESV